MVNILAGDEVAGVVVVDGVVETLEVVTSRGDVDVEDGSAVVLVDVVDVTVVVEVVGGPVGLVGSPVGLVDGCGFVLSVVSVVISVVSSGESVTSDVVIISVVVVGGSVIALQNSASETDHPENGGGSAHLTSSNILGYVIINCFRYAKLQSHIKGLLPKYIFTCFSNKLSNTPASIVCSSLPIRCIC